MSERPHAWIDTIEPEHFRSDAAMLSEARRGRGESLASFSAPSLHTEPREESLPSDWVRLNVGGTLMLTTRSTLVAEPDSVLAKMFSPDSRFGQPAKDQSGAYLLDADPHYFQVLLNFLRRGEIVLNGHSRAGVLMEAKFFGLQRVVNLLEPPLPPQPPALNWEDVGGLEGVKKELQQVVDHAVKFKDKFQMWGVGPTKNILLYGPPGCGKTLLARVTANQINANFIWVKCPELVNDTGRDTMIELEDEIKRARSMQPCIVFLEEFECIAKVRSAREPSFRDKMISNLAIMLDNVTAGWESVFVFAATNRPDTIEPALLRPGRFDQLIYIPMPDAKARQKILQAALRRVTLSSDVNLSYLAEHTHGFSGADLKEICQRACKFAIRENIESGSDMIVHRHHLEAAMRYSRRSVSDEDVYRYENFNRVLQQIVTKTFTFPTEEPD